MGDLTRIGREVQRLRSGQGRRYPAKLKRRIVREVGRARDRGMTWSAIVDDIGVPIETLRRWLADDANDANEASELRPVVIAEPLRLEAREVVVVTPAGYRVEGLDADEAVALLRKLSS